MTPTHDRFTPLQRALHWLMAASMFTLLFTAFLPKVGVAFPWVTWHWIAGTVLTVSVVFHVIHASLWLDFWAIWPDRTDLQDAVRRVRRVVKPRCEINRRCVSKNSPAHSTPCLRKGCPPIWA